MFLTLGQEPVLRDAENSAHLQLTGRKIAAAAVHLGDEEVFQVLCDSAAGLDVLLVLDDVWKAEHITCPRDRLQRGRLEESNAW